MAADEHRVTPTFPNSTQIDWQRVEYDYDQESDTIAMYLFGSEQPALVMHTSSDIDLLIEPTSSLVVGFQIEGFLAQAIYRDPQYLLLARSAGIDPEVLAQIEHDIDPVARRQADFQILADERLLTSA